MRKGSFKISVILILISLIIPFFGINTKKVKADTAPWFDTNYLFRVKVTIKLSQPLFWTGKNPVKIDLNSGNAPFFWEFVQPDARDIVVTDKDGNELSYWIEEWDYANKRATIWINFYYPGMSGGWSDTNIAYIYYDNPFVLFGHGRHTETDTNGILWYYSGYGDETFDFFDDFEGNELDKNKWDSFNDKFIHVSKYDDFNLVSDFSTLYLNPTPPEIAWIKSKKSPSGNNFVWETRFEVLRGGLSDIEYPYRVKLLVHGSFDVDGDGNYDDDDEYGCFGRSFSFWNKVWYYWGDYTNKEIERRKWYKSIETCNGTKGKFTWEVYNDIGGSLDFMRDANIVGVVDGKIELHAGGDTNYFTNYEGTLKVDYVFLHKILPSYSVSLLEEKQVDLEVSVTSNTDSVYSGEDIEFTVTASNNDSNY